MAENNQVVKSNSAAYGYNYASLADIVKQEFKIPKMRVKPTEMGNFMEYQDDQGEWHIGAPIVVPEMKGMNAAQAMGSALTYARRYTAQMALGLACDDDSKLEKTKGAPEATGKVYETPASEKQLGYIRKLLGEQGLTPAQVDTEMAKVKSMKQAKAIIDKLTGK